MNDVFKNKIKRLPKVDLHCHLDGSLRTKSIIDQARKDNADIPSKQAKVLESIIKIKGQESSLENYLDKFKITLCVMQTSNALERFAFELIEDVHKENVVYIEVRFSPILHINSGMKPEVSIESVYEGLKRGEKKYNVKFGIIICGMRNLSPEKSLKLAKLEIEHKKYGVLALILQVLKAIFLQKTIKKHLNLLKNNLKCTIHEVKQWDLIYLSSNLYLWCR